MADQDPTAQSNQAAESSSSSSGSTQAAATAAVDSSPPTTTTDPPSSSSTSSPSPASPPQTCSHCSKAASSSSGEGEGEKEKEKEGAEKPLKPCTKCQSVRYCSRDCQKADFKRHKRECARAAQVYAQRADIRMAVPGRAPREGFRGGLQKWQFDT
ncbi:MYND domain protein, putative [Drepanopeziza brunnea f. sp. 'multigermtubi' MB_m1]|uniref:MYND domain protein, putative n=1 Tax=Marssonina brunnea f. sp. multigermtubi (strain MB_m1) TaxID=1072389 RepID=K1XS72_MARBU|nr:MYND domain protein, putative [Drepanopeziza brunnea f. sp. 'multigermtubi' MB_m1]EKD15419.1 MYND domain protein, putative [Drepanopeziza brunnea f. sp. 'multigermtubi' MB_m1]